MSTITVLKAWGIMLSIGLVAHAGSPYLPLLGPTPLRMQAVKSPSSIATFEYAVPVAPLPTNSPTLADAKNSGVVTNVTNVSLTLKPVLVASAPDDQVPGDAFTSSVFALPPPDLLGISPEILATYFHQVQTGSNSALIGPFHVSFTPPVTADHSSHASYIVK